MSLISVLKTIVENECTSRLLKNVTLGEPVSAGIWETEFLGGSWRRLLQQKV
jgi:hypothetical protein